ncbi:thioredoxin H2-like [Impatiens glandulifera]|uniref:thioredoxin H2-like n=1 Tax=Impatiens glandulifera TaxID=253017 RepID=UPI001FB0526E|nr:thioredoxin H2-like [Impatiens glandulifera]
MGAEYSTSMDDHDQTNNSNESGQVLAFHSLSKWRSHFDSYKATNKLMVIDFTATWCRPCALMEPFLEELATVYTDVEFIKIDVDELPGVAREYGVQAMPSFVLVKMGEMIDVVMGAKKEELKKRIDELRV